ncbi:MAG: hypothetical protein R2882_14950 [Gemmatimonadales bacterium]
MASNSGPDRLGELEQIAAMLEDELAGWRRRCLKAETELDEARNRVPAVSPADLAAARQQVTELEAENQALRQRIAHAREQVEQLRTRLRFVGDQVGGEIG